MTERFHAESCMFNRGADCDCGFDDTAWQRPHEVLDELDLLLAEAHRIELPTEEMVNDWNIHNDHAQGNAELPDVEDDYGWDQYWELD